MLLNLDNLPKKGEAVTFVFRGTRFQMVVNEARIRYGQIDVRISPVAGEGSFWVRYDSVKKNTESVLDTVNACGVNESESALIG